MLWRPNFDVLACAVDNTISAGIEYAITDAAIEVVEVRLSKAGPIFNHKKIKIGLWQSCEEVIASCARPKRTARKNFPI